MFLNNQQVTEEIKREMKKSSRNKWQWKHDNSKPMGCSKSSSKREVYSNINLPQETRKTLNRQPNFTPKTTGKRKTKNPKIIRRKEILNIQADKWKRNETIVKINKTKNWFFEKINKTDSLRKKEESNQQDKQKQTH